MGMHTSTAYFLFLLLLPHCRNIRLTITVFSLTLVTEVECCLYNQFILSILFQGQSINISRKCTSIKRLLAKQNCLIGQSLEELLVSKADDKGYFCLPLQDVHVSIKAYHSPTGNNSQNRGPYNKVCEFSSETKSCSPKWFLMEACSSNLLLDANCISWATGVLDYVLSRLLIFYFPST